MPLYQNTSVAILMCTFNGEDFIEEQLQSIKEQDYENWVLYVNDDGSCDKTLDILKAYQKKWGVKKLIIRRGPQKGFQRNFLHIICDKKIQADLYFLSDQDDVWMPHKLSHTIKKISTLDFSKPALYCARTTYVSRDSKKILGQSDLYLKPPSFRNAIVQSIAGGNTMAFNNTLKNLVSQFKEAEVVSHDWWLYIVNELASGQTLYDEIPTIFYRQHSKSIVGANVGIMAKLKRFIKLLGGVYRDFNSKHFYILNKINRPSTNPNIRLIDDFIVKRDKEMLTRFSMVNDLGLYRQTLDGQIALYIGAILHKL
jgi:glycosyltransferase involved in cell wall biosynthesis